MNERQRGGAGVWTEPKQKTSTHPPIQIFFSQLRVFTLARLCIACLLFSSEGTLIRVSILLLCAFILRVNLGGLA